jgi:hypothetical protein
VIPLSRDPLVNVTLAICNHVPKSRFLSTASIYLETEPTTWSAAYSHAQLQVSTDIYQYGVIRTTHMLTKKPTAGRCDD